MTDPSAPTIEELVRGLKDLSNGRITLQQENERLKGQIDELRGQLAVSQEINQQQPVTQDQLDTARAEVTELTAERDGMKTQIVEQDAVIAEQQAVLASLQQELDTLKAAATKAISTPQTAANPSVEQMQPGGFIDTVMTDQNRRGAGSKPSKRGRGFPARVLDALSGGSE